MNKHLGIDVKEEDPHQLSKSDMEDLLKKVKQKK